MSEFKSVLYELPRYSTAERKRRGEVLAVLGQAQIYCGLGEWRSLTNPIRDCSSRVLHVLEYEPGAVQLPVCPDRAQSAI